MSFAVRKFVPTVVAVVASALAVVSLTVSAVSSSSPPGSTVAVLQMNLCLSGQASCYEGADHAAVLDEATAQIEDHHPAAVTINEACRRDAAEIARRTGYAMSFATVDYGGTPLPCIEPRGRGVFGIAVLTRDGVTSWDDQPFSVQADPEERRWLCATTSSAVTFCTAHLSTRASTGERAANDSECRQLRNVLAQHQRAGTTFFGGDLNRDDSCAPAGMWTVRDTTASQSPGLQHVYGTTSAEAPSASVTMATYTDHDFLVVTAAGSAG
jgi:endonuclease/exonuclease/phosphatase family metal-dependent hydrolase